MKILLAIIVGIAYIAAALFVSAWAGSTLWEWFIAPFFSLPLLTYPQALGLAIATKYFTAYTLPYEEEKTDNEKIVAAINPFITPIVLVLFGWIIKGFM